MGGGGSADERGGRQKRHGEVRPHGAVNAEIMWILLHVFASPLGS
jgi:hypothetical protein